MADSAIAAFWSAVAASCSALAAIVAIGIQRRNLLESVRPELVLTGWSRSRKGTGTEASEALSIKSLKNVGRGSALHIYMKCAHIENNKPVAFMSTKRLPILAPSEQVELDAEIVLYWKNARSSPDGSAFIPIEITICSLDAGNRWHKTIYTCMAFELNCSIVAGDTVADGVALSGRRTSSRAVWSPRLQRRLARIPLLGTAFRDAEDR